MKNYYTEDVRFYGNTNPKRLLEKYGSPLYVYNESILRQRCREMMKLVTYPKFRVYYSTKANSNIYLLRIIHEEGLHADAISPGEIFFLQKAGFKPQEIFYIGNNVSPQEMKFAIESGVTISVDSLSQLEQYGALNPGGKVAIRINPGIGAGHSEKVMTAGNNTKFGIYPHLIPQVKRILKEHNLKLVGINQHIGSLFMEPTPYIEAAKTLLSIAEEFDELEFIDFGGGFGIPYRKQEGEKRLELKALGEQLDEIIASWTAKRGIYPAFQIEPGRYIVAECGVLLGEVYAVKEGYNTTYVGTDLGFNVLIRPAMYNSHHDVEVYDQNGQPVKTDQYQNTTVVGNICESGDIITKNRLLPIIKEGYILGIMDAGAYGYSMASNYNSRLRPAEVLIDKNGNDRLIRRRENFDDLLSTFNF